MGDLPERTSGPLKALLVLGWSQRMWVKEARLPFPPFPGLGIRIDVYDMLRVESEVVGDRVMTSPVFAPSRVAGRSTPRPASGRLASKRLDIRSVRMKRSGPATRCIDRTDGDEKSD